MNKICSGNTLLFSSVLACTLLATPNVVRGSDFSEKKTIDNTTPCSQNVSGSYLTKIFNSDGTIGSRGVITLTTDGNFFVIDSNQGGVTKVFNPFSSGQGAWKCNGKTGVSARSVTFAYPGSAESTGSIARSDYQASFNPQTQTVEGTIILRFFNLNANPLLDNVLPVGTFNFSGQQIKAN
ncbi:hypothetical protein [Nostoc sp. 'Peltigera malacea cyanobiont' DB3992]|uniref:hypothetical protein n=1 Tax=Nostoc sp. 'Peltigera malacea cyanobiont' DB3992 TaxID=1206980 RepID=UPI000C055DB2|nr:hypothetical protein [Nostoc sp. 'Peltigera malacea cyanobiont' DB3992]PHM10846.1 hypothetical protein CK516_06165 [Nostoc sp. 'Peltigera malacea cyanobiont' DB3992]